MSRFDIALLALFRAARQQDHQRRTVLPEIGAIALSEIDSILKHALTDRFNIGEVALLQSDDGARDLWLAQLPLNRRTTRQMVAGRRRPRSKGFEALTTVTQALPGFKFVVWTVVEMRVGNLTPPPPQPCAQTPRSAPAPRRRRAAC